MHKKHDSSHNISSSSATRETVPRKDVHLFTVNIRDITTTVVISSQRFLLTLNKSSKCFYC